MQITRIASGAALLLVAGLFVAAASDTRFALAAKGGKPKTFDCASSNACVTGTNKGSGPGVTGTSSMANGIAGYTSSGVASGVYGENDSAQGGTGVLGRSQAQDAIGITAEVGITNALPVYLTAEDPNFSYMILGADASGDAVFAAGNTGDLTISGELFTSGSCDFGCSGTRRVVTYEGTASQPTLQDGGESALHGGEASVPLDSAFRNAIDPRGYVVLLTPEGRTKGLYVAARTDAGFVVREVRGGHGNAAFAYRIVARPYGVHAARLPIVRNLLDADRGAHATR